MSQRLNHRLECPQCGTLYLKFPTMLLDDSLIHCSACGELLGRWIELEKDFYAQGGQSGVFELHDGQIIRIDESSS
jgi:hypothetical protein